MKRLMTLFVAIAAAVFASTALAVTNVLRVAPSGTGDGSSWDSPIGVVSNALGIADRMVRNGECDHVEIWIKKGRYWATGVNNKDHYSFLPSEVTLRGGFAGTETSADEADPVANRTYLNGDRGNDSVWRPEGDSSRELKVWIDASTVREPNPDGADKYWTLYRGNSGYDVSYGFRYQGSVSNVCFNGITFVCYAEGAIVPYNSESSIFNLTITNCQFIACLGTDVQLRGRDNLIVDSSFRGNTASIGLYSYTNRVDGGWAPKSATISGCEFIEHGGTLPDITSKDSANGAYALITNCVFRANSTYSGNRPLIYLESDVVVTNEIVDCLFVSNRVYEAGGSMIGSFNTTHQRGSSAFVTRCRFVDNVATNTTISGSVCIRDQPPDRHWFIDDSLFMNNREYSDSAVTRAVVYCPLHSNINGRFRNCTIISNSVVTAGNAATFYGTFSGEDLRLQHLLIKDNKLVAGSAGVAAEVLYGGNLTGSPVCTAINTIFDNDAEGYLPFWNGSTSGTKPSFGVLGCYVPAGFDILTVIGNFTSNHYSVVASERPQYTPLARGPNGAGAIGVKASPREIARGGCPIFINTEGVSYVYDPSRNASKPYYPADGTLASGTAKTAAQALCTTESPILLDAFGASRKFGRVALGPLNAPVAGLTIVFR